MVEIEVCEVRGRCPIYKVGDKIVVDDPEIVLEKTDVLYTHALSSLLNYSLVLKPGADAVELCLSKPENREHAYIQCVDPGAPYTDGETMVFKIRRTAKDKYRE